MRLDWKDAASTALVVVALTLAFSVTQGWNWPLLGGVREGIIVLALVGFGAHLFGAPRERFYYTDPFGLLMVLIVVAGMAVGIVGGLITGTMQYLIVLMGVVTVLWAFATLRHAVEGHTPPRQAISA